MAPGTAVEFDSGCPKFARPTPERTFSPQRLDDLYKTLDYCLLGIPSLTSHDSRGWAGEHPGIYAHLCRGSRHPRSMARSKLRDHLLNLQLP